MRMKNILRIGELLKKKAELKCDDEPDVEVDEPKMTYTDYLMMLNGNNGKMTPQQRADFINSIFVRSVDSLRPIDAKTGVAMDDAGVQMTAKLNNNMYCCISDAMLRMFGTTFIGWQACAMLKQNPFIDKACEIPCRDAIAPDYVLTYDDKDDIDKDGREDIEDEQDKEKLLEEIKTRSKNVYDINNVCQRMSVNKKVFGYGLVMPVVSGAKYDKPFNIDGIKRGSYKGMVIVEPYWVSPQLDAESASDPASLHFYEPTWYAIGSKRVHRSWVIKVVNSQVADILKPTYYFGGIPLTQQIYERVYAAEKVANEAPLLALSKRMLVIDAQVANLVANPDEADRIMKAVTQLRDNWGVFIKNPGDTVNQIDTALNDFDSLIMSQYQLVASIAQMPATKLLKTTPKGFNSTGEYEQEDYIQSLMEIQENDYVPLINRHNELMTKSEYGKVISLNVKFNPVDTPTEKEVAEVDEIRSRTATNLINAGVVSAEEERNILRADRESRYTTLPEDMPEDMEFGQMELDLESEKNGENPEEANKE